MSKIEGRGGCWHWKPQQQLHATSVAPFQPHASALDLRHSTFLLLVRHQERHTRMGHYPQFPGFPPARLRAKMIL